MPNIVCAGFGRVVNRTTFLAMAPQSATVQVQMLDNAIHTYDVKVSFVLQKQKYIFCPTICLITYQLQYVFVNFCQ